MCECWERSKLFVTLESGRRAEPYTEIALVKDTNDNKEVLLSGREKTFQAENGASRPGSMPNYPWACLKGLSTGQKYLYFGPNSTVFELFEVLITANWAI